MNCPLCGKGSLIRETRSLTLTHRGSALTVDQPGDWCEACGEGILSVEDLAVNEAVLRAWMGQVKESSPDSKDSQDSLEIDLMTRTSDTHPLRIDAVAVPGHTGLIGLTFCPGKKQKAAMTGVWDRDIDKDLATILAWGGSVLISLIEEHEFVELDVTELPQTCIRHNIAWYGLPIVDGAIPDKGWEDNWKKASPSLHQTLRQGGRIVIHCKGGLGRTGLLAARILVEFGMSPSEAIRQVRQARPGAIETSEQEDYVLSCWKGPLASLPTLP